MPRLLALDLSTNVGWALCQSEGGRPQFGTLVLEGYDLARKLGMFRRWLDEFPTPFDALSWERPLILPTDTVGLLELLYGLVGVCYSHAGLHRMPWTDVTVSDVKIALTGKGKATKEEMLYAARRVCNWPVTNDHEADAGAVGVVACGRLWP